jgi:hypothetical protein
MKQSVYYLLTFPFLVVLHYIMSYFIEINNLTYNNPGI